MLLTDQPVLTYYYWPGEFWRDGDGGEFVIWPTGVKASHYRCYAVDAHGYVWRVPYPSVSRQPHSYSVVYWNAGRLHRVGYVLGFPPCTEPEAME